MNYEYFRIWFFFECKLQNNNKNNFLNYKHNIWKLMLENLQKNLERTMEINFKKKLYIN